jgi:hypothetical protein
VFFFWVLGFLGYKESWVAFGFGARVFLFSIWPCRNLVHFSKRVSLEFTLGMQIIHNFVCGNEEQNCSPLQK